MKPAFLILIHRYPNQAGQLVKSLLHDPDATVYMHIDAKALDVYEPLLKEFGHEQRVRFTGRRYRVYWGSYNQIRATVELLRCAAPFKHDYYALLSGQDVPVKSIRAFKEFLEQNNGKEFLTYNKLPDYENWGDLGGLERLERYTLDIRIPSLRFFYNKVNALFYHLQRLFRHKRKLNFVPHGGANWFNLSRSAVEYILDYLRKNPSYLHRFKYTRCADEIFTQSLLCNSPFHNKLVNDCLRYVDWHSGPEQPRVLRMDDLDRILQHKTAFFGRKFDETVDKNIIATLYERIHE